MIAEIDITHISQRGQGVGYDDSGNIYFVDGAIPGDRVEVSFAETGKRYRDATLSSLIKPSPDRIEAVCSHFGECGGCDWLQWEYRTQAMAKGEMLFHLLERNGIRFRHKSPILEAPSPLGYRNRIQLHIEDGKIGFHKRRSHEIVEIEYCHIARQELNHGLLRLRKGDRELPRSGRIELSLTGGGVVRSLGDEKSKSFVQVNAAQNERLRDVVAEVVRSAGGKTILELYCGDGNLTFAYRPPRGSIIAVDANPSAIEKARSADDEAGAGIDFIQLHIDKSLPDHLPADFIRAYDTLILDPPRSGSDLLGIIGKEVMNIIYVSCSPSAFLRDIKPIAEDYSFESVQPIDMFPQTRHVEFVAHLHRTQYGAYNARSESR